MIAQIDLWNVNTLIIFTYFFIPGFITLGSYRFFSAKPLPNWSESLFEVIVYSIINFIILSPIGFLLKPNGATPLVWVDFFINSNLQAFYNTYGQYGSLLYSVIFIFVLFVAPFLWAIVSIELMKHRPERLIIRSTSKPWDYIFSKDEEHFILVHLKNGKHIAGKYGTGSIASSYPANEQIYLEEVWEVNEVGTFTEKINNEGMLIFGEEILAIEFYK